jgi:hypothetical protein
VECGGGAPEWEGGKGERTGESGRWLGPRRRQRAWAPGPGLAVAAAGAVAGTVEGAVDAAADAEEMADGERVSSSRAGGEGAASCAGADPPGEYGRGGG